VEYWTLLFLIVPLYCLVGWFVTSLWDPVYWLLARMMHRVNVYHADRIPKTGPCLICSNHVTYIDWILLWTASPRPVTFVLAAKFYKNPFFRFILSFARSRTIRIDTTRGRPHAMIEALNIVVNALDEGRVVVVFPEGTLSRNGQMLPFGRGIEHILKKAKVPIPVVPVHLYNLYGTLMSWDYGRILWKWPKARRRVAIYFGKPLPPTTPASEIRQAVQECEADAAIAQSDYLLPPDRQFIRNAARFRKLFKPAFTDVSTGTERTLTWGKLLVGVWGLVGWLKKVLGPEPNVGVWLPTGLGSALTNYALAMRGKVAVNLNYTTGPDVLLSSVQQADLRTVITAKRFVARIPLSLPDGIRVLYLEDALAAIPGWEKTLKFLCVVLFPGWFLEKVLIRSQSRMDGLLTILFSSGSTGEPKGVMLSNRNIAGNVDGFAKALNIQPGDKLLSTLPFFHTFGFTVGLWAPAAAPIDAVMFPDPRQAKEIGEICKKTCCTVMLGTATFTRFYLRRAEKDDFKTVRFFICGAEKLPVKLAKEFEEKFGILPLEGYGCTELAPVVSANLHDVNRGGLKQRANTFGTVGQPIPGVVARTFDPETFEPLPTGKEGLIGAKGSNVMVGYLHHPEKTAHSVRNGWYITGDIGVIEPEGFIRITGRVSRFAKIAGEMVPLERLDEEMHEILAAGGDRVLAVAAVPDEKRGERVVVLHLEAIKDRLEEVFAQLRTRGLPNLWIPDLRDCYAVESFPVLGSGKLDLRAVGLLAKQVTA